MNIQETKGIIEAVLFASGNEIKIKMLQLLFEKSNSEIKEIIEEMNEEYLINKRGFEIIVFDDNVQLTSRKEYYEYIEKVLDKKNKPKLSNAALETLSIIAYNPSISRAEIEGIRRSKC